MRHRFLAAVGILVLGLAVRLGAESTCPQSGGTEGKRHDDGVGVGIGVSVDLGGIGKRKKEEDPFGDPPAHTHKVEDHALHHCQGGRLMIVAGKFDAKNPEDPMKTQRLERTETDPDILGTLAWARTLHLKHLHLMAYRAANSGDSIDMKTPYEVRNGSWQPMDLGVDFSKLSGDQAPRRAASEALAAQWTDCCYFDEVIIIMHGGQNAYPALVQFLPYVLSQKPVRKFVLWSCRSSRKFYPGDTGDGRYYQKICQILRPHDCPCGCDHDKCNGFDADGRRVKCPTADDKVTIYASYVVDNVAAKLGLDSKDKSNHSLTTPDGKLRKITVDKEGSVEAEALDASGNNTDLFGGLSAKPDPGLVSPKSERTETVDTKDLLKGFRLGAPAAPTKILPAAQYFGPKACSEKEGCLPGARPPAM